MQQLTWCICIKKASSAQKNHTTREKKMLMKKSLSGSYHITMEVTLSMYQSMNFSTSSINDFKNTEHLANEANKHKLLHNHLINQIKTFNNKEVQANQWLWVMLLKALEDKQTPSLTEISSIITNSRLWEHSHFTNSKTKICQQVEVLTVITSYSQLILLQLILKMTF